MIVKLKANKRIPPGLEAGRAYPVLGIEADSYRIIDQTGRPCLYEAKFFTILDGSMPNDWVKKRGDEGELYAYPRSWMRPGFFEDFFDGKKRAVAAFWRIVNGQLMTQSRSQKNRVTTHNQHALVE
jgi:hypothetical protein